MTTSEDIDQLLEVIWNLQAGDISRNVLLAQVAMHFDNWEKEKFVETANTLIELGLAEKRGHDAQPYVRTSASGRARLSTRNRPSHTQNIVTVGQGSNIAIQQGGAQSNLNQNVGFTVEEREHLSKLVEIFEHHVHELRLSAIDEKRTNTQIQTIKIQIDGEPEPEVIRQSVVTLRRITEAAIGGILGSAVTGLSDPNVWQLAHNILSLFGR